MKNYLPSLPLTHLKADISSGIVVFLVAIPLCLGIAAASEAPLMSGIIAGFIGGIVVSLFGGSALGVSGPAAGLVAIILDANKEFAEFANTPEGIFQVIMLATLLAGGIQLLLGVLKAGVVAYYFPSSVIKGMLAAIGAIIILKQLPHAFGDDRDYAGDLKFMQADGENTFTEIGAMLENFQLGALLICGIGLAILILWEQPFIKSKNWSRILSGPLLVVISGIFIQLAFEAFAPELAVEGLQGLTPRGEPVEYSPMVDLPADQTPAEWIMFPAFSMISKSSVWIYALIIAGVASIESLLCAEATDKLDPQKRITPINKELRAQGIANIVSGLIGGLPITQVIVRSSANVQSGGKTRFAAFAHGVLILVAILLLPGVLNMIPMASLAAILLMVGYKLLRPSIFKTIYAKGIGQFIPFLVTIIAILITDLLTGIAIGTAVAGIFILIDNFKVPYTYEMGRSESGRPFIRIILSEVVSFLNKGNILSTLREIPEGTDVIVDASRTYVLDPDVKEVIEDFAMNAEYRDVNLTWIHAQKSAKAHKDVKELRNILKKAPDKTILLKNVDAAKGN